MIGRVSGLFRSQLDSAAVVTDQTRGPDARAHSCTQNLIAGVDGGLALQQRQDRLDVAVLSRPVQRRLAVLRGE